MTGPDDRDVDGQNGLDLPTRKRIFEHVESNPGIHFSQLKRDLDVETGTLQHHLRELEEYGILESQQHQGKRRVFVTDELTDDEKEILSVLRYGTTRRILLYLLEDGPATNRDVADSVGVTPATISWHLSNLVEAGVVEATRQGRTTRYRVSDEETTVQLLVRYRESFVDRAVDRIVEFWG